VPDALTTASTRDRGIAAFDAYPLTWPGVVAGAIAGTAVLVLFDSTLAGLAILVLLAGVGLTWRRGEAPVFPFVIGFQWTSVVIGRAYESAVGDISERYAPGDVDRAMLLGLVGLLVLAIGIRLGSGRGPAAADAAQPEGHLRRTRTLFWVVMAAYLIDYAGGINPKDYGGLEQFVQVGLNCRQMLLMALWFDVLAGHGPRRYLAITFAWVFMPSLGNYFSTFKGPPVLLVLVAASTWRPWQRAWWRTSAPRVLALVPVGLVLLLLAVVWQSGVKRETRKAYDRAEISGGVSGRLRFFADRAGETVPGLIADPQPAFDELVGRLSYVTFFSRVLDHVPRAEPHSRGELLRMAFLNAFVPRALYPDKPALPSDSYYTRRFAAAQVAEGMTSISIGYMAEFYADWGVAGMFASIFGYGLWMGAIARGLRAVVRPALLVSGALAVVFLQVAEFEHQFIKGFAAINVSFAVLAVLMIAARGPLARLFDAAAPAGRGTSAVLRPGAVNQTSS
jgi:hypothetical protein